MKKLTLTLLAVLMAAALTLTACTSKDDNASDNVNANPGTEDAAGDNDGDNEEPAPAGNDAAMDEIVAEMQEAIGSINSMLGGVMEVSISARGSALVYTYTILSDEVEVDQATMDAQVESMSASFDTLLSAMDEYGVNNPSIVIEFIDLDGNEIGSVTY